VRLTLRTLLAYLDDTLDPGQTKLIGQKVAESDTAQELVARIKQVTRRRRLTTPIEAGPAGKIDPNTIAEYLDNVVSAEQQADIEQICLASDVHLAEVAACHQILTLVLGEPALVPPPAKQRMYGLVKGPEAIPYRKPPVRAEREHEAVEEKETDETLRLGLPAYGRKTGWRQRLLLVGGAAVAAALLVFAVLQVMNPSRPATSESSGTLVAQNDKENQTTRQTGQNNKEHHPEGAGSAADQGKGDKQDASAGNKEKKPEQKQEKKQVIEKNKETKPAESGAPPKLPFTKPSTRQVLVGDYVPPNSGKEASVLLQAQGENSEWRRVEVKKPEVYSARPLVSLPGCRSVVETKGGVRLTLWGYLPELWPDPPLMESLVELHYSEQPLIELDMTLRRGRVVLLNLRDAPARVRVRFENPTNPEAADFFDITLRERNSEILLERWSLFADNEPFYRNPKNAQRLGPVAWMGLIALSGEAYLRFNDLSSRLEAPCAVLWNSVKGDLSPPRPLPKVPEWISTNPPLPEKMREEDRKNWLRSRAEMLRARDEIATDMSVKEVGVALKEAVTTPKDPSKRTLAVRCFAAIDDLPSLVDALDQGNFADVRQAAVQTLQTWIASSRDAEYRLYAFLQQNKYNLREAANIMDLLHSTYHSPQAMKDPVTYDTLIGYLGSELLPIRELAAWHLYRLYPQAVTSIPFNATAPPGIRNRIQEAWRKVIPPGKLPPSMTK
jgi:hypothetical protein